MARVQQKVSDIRVPWIRSLHEFPGVPSSFRPWESGLSPSALYNCSLSCRKQAKIRTPEVKWMSIKRWVTTTPGGIRLPSGVYFSVKRRETFVAAPTPRFDQKVFVLMMFQYGNVWSQKAPDDPITEEWLWSDSGDGTTVLEALMRRDAAFPLAGYFKSCLQFMADNPDQIGIHLKRKKKDQPPDPSEAG